jgi:hypothetical protein
MFCPNCASPIEADATHCTSCGKSVGAKASPADRAIARARISTKDAKLAVRSMLKDPLGTVGETYQSLGEVKARSAAMGLLTLFVVVAAFALYRSIPRGFFGYNTENEFKLLFTSVLFGVVIAAVMLFGRAFARMTFRGKVNFNADLFVTSMSLLVLAAPLLLFGLFKLDSEISALLVWASILVVSPFALLIQYESNIQIANLRKNQAAWVISLTLVYATFLLAIVAALIAQLLK